jgi:hypothetical protein
MAKLQKYRVLSGGYTCYENLESSCRCDSLALSMRVGCEFLLLQFLVLPATFDSDPRSVVHKRGCSRTASARMTCWVARNLSVFVLWPCHPPSSTYEPNPKRDDAPSKKQRSYVREIQ